jgi:hypothetical protein
MVHWQIKVGHGNADTKEVSNQSFARSIVKSASLKKQREVEFPARLRSRGTQVIKWTMWQR